MVMELHTLGRIISAGVRGSQKGPDPRPHRAMEGGGPTTSLGKGYDAIHDPTSRPANIQKQHCPHVNVWIAKQHSSTPAPLQPHFTLFEIYNALRVKRPLLHTPVSSPEELCPSSYIQRCAALL